jgi:hypothetical protein
MLDQKGAATLQQLFLDFSLLQNPEDYNRGHTRLMPDQKYPRWT